MYKEVFLLQLELVAEIVT